MTLRPDNLQQLREQMGAAKSIHSFNLAALSQLTEHVPENMTATVQAGMTLDNFQSQLAKRSQWLPIDPPCPADLSIGALLATNASGPRRFGCGTIRDWLIGMAVVLPDGRLIRNGGKVVKNVAGFDLCKLFIGSHGTLGVIVEATFKLAPRPELEVFLTKETGSLDSTEELLETIWHSDLQPHVLDIHRINDGPVTLVAGFAGTRADVEAQTEVARQLGVTTETDLDYDGTYRSTAHTTVSVAPAKVMRTLRSASNCDFVARAGNGIIYPRYHHPWKIEGQIGDDINITTSPLQSRIKKAFDPEGVLP